MNPNARTETSNRELVPDGVLPGGDSILDGVRVLDVGQMLAGPMIGSFLGDFGADVIKIERPLEGDPLRKASRFVGTVPLWWTVLARNKRSVSIDLQNPMGRELFLELVRSADVVIESFRPGTLEKLRLGPDELFKIRPELILVRVSGYGQTGPYADRPGFGKAVEALTGVVELTGYEDGPPLHTGFPMADVSTAVMGAFGVMLALYKRASGRAPDVYGGEVIDLAIYETPLRMIDNVVVEYGALGVVPTRCGNRQPSVRAFSDAFLSRNGRWISVNGGTFRVLQRMFEAIGEPNGLERAGATDMESALGKMELISQKVGSWVGKHDGAEVVKEFSAAGAVAAQINGVEDLFQDPQIAVRENILRLVDESAGELACPGVVPRLTNYPGAVRTRGPRLGEHTAEVLTQTLGLSDEKISELRTSGAIGMADEDRRSSRG